LAQDIDAVCANGGNCRFESVLCWSSVNDQRYSFVQFFEHVLRCCGAYPAEPICTRRGERFSKNMNDFGKDWMGTDSHCDSIKTRRDDFRNCPALR